MIPVSPYVRGVLPETPEMEPVPTRDESDYFCGWWPRECGEHRTTGDRAWCYACAEWCSTASPCVRCERGVLLRALKALVEDQV